MPVGVCTKELSSSFDRTKSCSFSCLASTTNATPSAILASKRVSALLSRAGPSIMIRLALVRSCFNIPGILCSIRKEGFSRGDPAGNSQTPGIPVDTIVSSRVPLSLSNPLSPIPASFFPKARRVEGCARLPSINHCTTSTGHCSCQSLCQRGFTFCRLGTCDQ